MEGAAGLGFILEAWQRMHFEATREAAKLILIAQHGRTLPKARLPTQQSQQQLG